MQVVLYRLFAYICIMSYLEKTVIQDFRNITLQELDFSPNVNCISGGNGEGKTNLLDAIWYMSMAKSAFAQSDVHNFRRGCSSFALSGLYHMDNGLQSRFSIGVGAQGKQIRRDDKPYERISEHIGVLPIVMVSPADTALISESGEQRRRFANSVISQMDSGYLAGVQNYGRILMQRNRVLKDPAADIGLLESFDMMLARDGALIHEKRARFASELTPLVRKYYERISGGREDVSIRYRSDLDRGPLDQLLRESRERDIAMRYTCAGVQRDEFVFTMDGMPLRQCGSQGQQKSFLVAVKFAQYEILRASHAHPPILLLDDLFDKLDMERVSNLLGMVAGNDFGQIFITDSNKVRIKGILDHITAESRFYEAKGGVYTAIDGD